MVLTDLPFHRPDAVASRYTLLKSPEDRLSAEEKQRKQIKSQEYATFLKEKERQCGPDGFLDSNKFKHTFALKSEKKDEALSRPQSVSVVDMQLKKERDEKEFEKRLKIIEDHMWQHKQEERELKRVEGDILKNQRAVRRTIREFESAMTRKRLEETKKLNSGLEKYTRLQNTHIHRKEEQTKQRIEASLTASQSQKDMGRKLQLTTSHLARQFKSKATELELKKIESERLSKEYEAKIKAKEDEQFRLKQELADLAINLNMEAQKGRQMEADVSKDRKKHGTNRIKDDRNADTSLENKLGKSEGDSKAAEMNRRKLSADLTHTRGHLQVKQREEGRHLQDTEARLRSNITEQKALTEAAINADLDLKARHIEKKMSDHENRRKILATRSHREKKERTEAQEAIYAEKAKLRHADVQRREHEDHLKFFQKMVTKGEEKEHNLYNQVRNAEYARQKQEQSVRRIQGRLNEVKKKNAQKIKQEMSELEKHERELEQRLVREQAVLGKAHAEKEEHYAELQRQRESLRKDRHILSEHEKEQARLNRIYHSLHAEREESFITLQKHRDVTREERHILDVHTKEHQRLSHVALQTQVLNH